MSEKIINDLLAASPNRRRFLQKLGVASAMAGAVAATGGAAYAQAAPTDADIVNFALNLEYLEAEFYTVATTGMNVSQMGIDVTGTGSSGPTTGGAQVNFSDPMVQAVAQELAADERTHVTLLKTALSSLGAQPVAKPAINLGALGIGFGNQNDFLTLARVFEDIGVTAYGGAAPLIQNKTILGYAARILAVEAVHSGNIRFQVARFNIATKPLDGADHVPPPSGSQYFPTDSMAITEVRTPGQVLYLAYAAANATSGGFFPSGVNGTINMSAGAAANTDGATLTANPNPIPVVGSSDGMTTITWNAPTAQVIQIRIGGPNGALFTDNFGTGSMATGQWVTDGMTFYLQDVTGGKALTAANTLATLVVHLKPM